MDLRQIEYFLAVVDHGGVTRAAWAIRIRPSSHGPPPIPPRTGIETALTTAGPATGPE